MTTIKKVAARANVATGTVSRVLQGASSVRADLRALEMRASDLLAVPTKTIYISRLLRIYGLNCRNIPFA
jgi:Bacterial regulatory proteins, lacI family